MITTPSIVNRQRNGVGVVGPRYMERSSAAPDTFRTTCWRAIWNHAVGNNNAPVILHQGVVGGESISDPIIAPET
jgi:hypothetical protein